MKKKSVVEELKPKVIINKSLGEEFIKAELNKMLHTSEYVHKMILESESLVQWYPEIVDDALGKYIYIKCSDDYIRGIPLSIIKEVIYES